MKPLLLFDSFDYVLG